MAQQRGWPLEQRRAWRESRAAGAAMAPTAKARMVVKSILKVGGLGVGFGVGSW